MPSKFGKTNLGADYRGFCSAFYSLKDAALLRLLARQPRLRPAPDPRLSWASRSQAHRSLHTRRRRTLRGALALSPGVFMLKATKLLPFWSVGHFSPTTGVLCPSPRSARLKGP